MIYLEEMTKSEQGYIEHLYEESFPDDEKKPFSMLLKLRKIGKASLLVIHESASKEAVGLCFFLLWKEKVLFDYFAIEPQKQCLGYGSAVLTAIAERFQGKCIFGEVEPIDETADNNEQRIRRMQFYLRNGLKETGIYVNLFGAVLQLMYMGDKPVSYSEYEAFLKHIFGLRGRKLLRENVHLIHQT